MNGYVAHTHSGLSESTIGGSISLNQACVDNPKLPAHNWLVPKLRQSSSDSKDSSEIPGENPRGSRRQEYPTRGSNMADLSESEIRALAKAAGVEIPERLLAEVGYSLNGLLETLEKISPPDWEQLEPLPIVLPHAGAG